MYKKKLIEVALPLEDINIASGREKSIRHGHPSTMHLWWARRPLATARAVLFASIVDDPSSHPEEYPTTQEQDKRREELFDIIRELVKWENTNNEDLLRLARVEMLKYTDKLPPVYDPFCGGGTIPIEAQRLGLTAYGSDLNPVAVTISKSLTELPYPYRDQPPVNPEAINGVSEYNNYKGLSGLAADVRFYGNWMRQEAFNRIGKLYPVVKNTDGSNITVIAWICARTVKCPNPACGCEMPLTRSWWLSKKKGKESWIEPVIKDKKIEYKVVFGKGKPSEGSVNRRGATCICCGSPVGFDYIRSESIAERMKSSLLAIVGEGIRGRVYMPANYEHVNAALVEKPKDNPEGSLGYYPGRLNTNIYGLNEFNKLFTNRQLTALMTFSDLVNESRSIICIDACKAGLCDDDAKRYADVVSVYLAFAVDKLADRCSTICSWDVSRDGIRNTFARQAIPMVWDFAEVNPFSSSSGNITNALEWIEECLLTASPNAPASIVQNNAMEKIPFSSNLIISTDPPYYDNICYADLSDYFYIWMRRSLRNVFPDIFGTMLVPKSSELVATPYRHEGDRKKAKEFFEDGLFRTFQNIYAHASDVYPVTIYYAFKQTDTENDSNENEPENDSSVFATSEASSGWETMLSGLIKADFTITGTWPMRTEMSNRSIAADSNALASSIILVCRKRHADAPMITRREFSNLLKRELRTALKELQSGNIAPVDLAQASIGPGMAVFSRYSQVLDSTGTPMTIRNALQMINQYLDEFLTEQEGELDPESRLCVTLYSEYGINEVPYGDVDVIARAKNTSLEHLESAGVLIAQRGKVRLLRRDELDPDWHPIGKEIGKNIVWLNTQQLATRLQKEGEQKSAELFIEMGVNMADCVRALTYRLFAIAEKKGWTEDALAYNSVIASWNSVLNSATTIKENHSNTIQMRIDDLGGY